MLRGHELRRAVTSGAFALLLVACSSRTSDEPKPSPAGSAAAPDTTSLGALSFALTEGTPAAREHFARGLLALHSFWYDEAIRQFEAAAKADPTMNMAYWGVAMSHLELLWGEDDLDAAKQALGRMPDPDRLSPREQAWVFATLALLGASDARSARTAYVKALEELHAQFPDDESATFLAVALLSTIRPGEPDETTVRKRAAELAKSVYARNPRHPGAAHYIIHAFDTPELAPLGLEMAKSYAQIAPAAFHAQHMPAHIFSRLGMWNEAIASCRAAWDASVSAAKRESLSANHHDFHSLSWLVEMPFELGHRRDAEAALTTFGDAIRAGLRRQHRVLYAEEVASYLMRTSDWSRVDDLLAPLDAAPVDEAAPASRTASLSHCGGSIDPAEVGETAAVLDTRALAAAMTHDVSKTTKLVAELEAARARLRALLASSLPKPMLDELAATHTRRARELRAIAKRDDRALLEVLRATDPAAARGGESNPSAFVVTEQIGDTLMRLGDAKAAADAYATASKEHPRRAHSLLGAARAAVKLGDTAAARTHYQALAELWRDADPSTDGLAEVRAFLEQPR